MSSRPSTILTGVSGEYFVAAELSRRGYIASITLRNTASVDILASSADGSRQVAIQVKTARSFYPSWRLSVKAETLYASNLFYVFVALGEGLPAFHIVPSKKVADTVRLGHAEWLMGTKRGGGKRKDTDIRGFSDEDGKYLERWDLLRL